MPLCPSPLELSLSSAPLSSSSAASFRPLMIAHGGCVRCCAPLVSGCAEPLRCWTRSSASGERDLAPASRGRSAVGTGACTVKRAERGELRPGTQRTQRTGPCTTIVLPHACSGDANAPPHSPLAQSVDVVDVTQSHPSLLCQSPSALPLPDHSGPSVMSLHLQRPLSLPLSLPFAAPFGVAVALWLMRAAIGRCSSGASSEGLPALKLRTSVDGGCS